MRSCFVCEKGRRVGNNVSHANNKTKKIWEPNLQRIRAVVEGKMKRIYACTRCIRSGKITKPPVVKRPVSAAAAA